VTKIASDEASPSGSTTDKRKSWWNPRKESLEGRAKTKDSEPASRSKLLDEHIASYNSKFLEIEDQVESRYDSLTSVADSVQKERQQVEEKIPSADISHILKNNKSDVLLKWLRLTLGMTTKAYRTDEDDDYQDDESMDSHEDSASAGEAFTLFGESTTSIGLDDSIANGLSMQRPLGILGESGEDSDASDDDELLY
jgi:hypothetical protein